jgi:hypothetical protein
MPEDKQRLSREGLLAALDAGWGRLLFTLAQWPDEKQELYARQQGYPRVQDLLAHVCAWWEETLVVVPRIWYHHAPDYDYDIDLFNARAVTRFQPWTRAQVEAHFEKLRHALAELIRNLPAEAFNDDRIYAWLLNATVEHYEEHQPPRGPRLR